MPRREWPFGGHSELRGGMSLAVRWGGVFGGGKLEGGVQQGRFLLLEPVQGAGVLRGTEGRGAAGHLVEEYIFHVNVTCPSVHAVLLN
jgi:hypothetical protein